MGLEDMMKEIIKEAKKSTKRTALCCIKDDEKLDHFDKAMDEFASALKTKIDKIHAEIENKATIIKREFWEKIEARLVEMGLITEQEKRDKITLSIDEGVVYKIEDSGE